jgi:hypothetical protein
MLQLQGWSPLGDPGAPVAAFASWRPLLESEAAARGSVLGAVADAAASGDPYMRLVAEIVLPPLRKELTNEWEPRWVARPVLLLHALLVCHCTWLAGGCWGKGRKGGESECCRAAPSCTLLACRLLLGERLPLTVPYPPRALLLPTLR